MAQEFKPLIATGPRVRKSPFFEATKRCGVKSFTIYNHMFMPVRRQIFSDTWTVFRRERSLSHLRLGRVA